MDDFDFLEDLEDEDDEFVLSDDLPLDDEFIRTHFNTCNNTIDNFPFIEDDIDAITDYELFSRGFGYLDEKKADKEELSDYAKKDEIPDVSEFVKKDTNELENYPLSSSLSDVAFSGDYDDLLDKPTIPTKTSDLNNDSGFITKSVNDLTNYTKTSDLSTVATTGDYDDLLNKPTLFSGNYNDLTNKPTIPTVNDGSLTLKRNGNVVQIFTANNATNLEADFSVPDISTTSISSELINSWGANGACITGKIGNVKFIQCCVRNGITDTVTTTFPYNFRPTEDLVLPAQSYTDVGYAILRTNGTLTVSSNFVNNNSNVLIGGIYL